MRLPQPEEGRVIRKHNRRAAKAAFAIALGVAIVLGGAAAAPASNSASGTPIILGTKNFTEQYVLGQLYKQALEAKGMRVGYKESIGSTELIAKALTSGQITLYPEYTGVMLTVTFGRKSTPKSALATYQLAKQLWGRRGYVLGNQTPFQDVDAVAVLKATANRYGLKTVGDLRKVPDLTLAAFPEFETRQTGLVGMRRAYGVTNVDFKPLAGISAYTLLDRGDVLAAGVFSTDPPLGSGKYVVLKDPRNIFGFQHVAPIVSRKLVNENPQLLPTLNRVSRLLTLKAMIAMNKAVAVDKRSPARVADAFLKANKLK
jgi:osmoprotectant transport system substrate-binding protein